VPLNLLMSAAAVGARTLVVEQRSIFGPFWWRSASNFGEKETRRSGVEDWGADYQTFSDSDFLVVVPSDENN
jgi:hypothetical protein